MVGPPVAAHGVDTAGWHAQTCVGGAQRCPPSSSARDGHEPPHPGQMPPAARCRRQRSSWWVSAPRRSPRRRPGPARRSPVHRRTRGHAPPLRVSSLRLTRPRTLHRTSSCRAAHAPYRTRGRLQQAEVVGAGVLHLARSTRLGGICGTRHRARDQHRDHHRRAAGANHVPSSRRVRAARRPDPATLPASTPSRPAERWAR